MDLSTSRVQHIQDYPSVYFIPFSSPPPPFQYYWPWIFHPIRGLSTSNRIDEYLQRSMDGNYPRVACNRPLSRSLDLLSSPWARPVHSMIFSSESNRPLKAKWNRSSFSHTMIPTKMPLGSSVPQPSRITAPPSDSDGTTSCDDLMLGPGLGAQPLMYFKFIGFMHQICLLMEKTHLVLGMYDTKCVEDTLPVKKGNAPYIQSQAGQISSILVPNYADLLRSDPAPTNVFFF